MSDERPIDARPTDQRPVGEADPFIDPREHPEARRHLRAILIAFVVVVVLLPFIAIGGRWALLLVPALLAAASAMWHALALRRLQRRLLDEQL